MEEEHREREVPPPATGGQVRVLTLHGSKGLEFPRVILVDFPERPGVKRDYPLLFWNAERGVFLGGRDEEGERASDLPREKEWRAFELAQSVSESKRLFYVALTRAREQLVLGMLEQAEENDQNESIGLGSTAVELGKGTPRTAKPSAELDSERVQQQDFWRGWVKTSSQWNLILKVRSTEIQKWKDELNLERALFLAKIPTADVGSDSVDGRLDLPALSTHREDSSPHERNQGPNEFKFAGFYRPRHSVTEWLTLHSSPDEYVNRFLRKMKPQEEGDDEVAKSIVTDAEPDEQGTAAVVSKRELALVADSAQPSLFAQSSVGEPGASHNKGVLRGNSLESRTLGTRVHSALERGDFEELKRIEDEMDQAFRAQPLIDWLNTSPWSVLRGATNNGQGSEFEGPNSNSRLVQRANAGPQTESREAWNELQFEVRVSDQETLVGAIDRLVRQGGEWVLIDYKISSFDRKNAAWISRYQTQLSLYAWAAARMDERILLAWSEGRFKTRIVAITPERVREIEVPLPRFEEVQASVDTWLSQSQSLLHAEIQKKF
jgi:ATP-dependent exoDNAse (exonuclease V) beta subunit